MEKDERRGDAGITRRRTNPLRYILLCTALLASLHAVGCDCARGDMGSVPTVSNPQPHSGGDADDGAYFAACGMGAEGIVPRANTNVAPPTHHHRPGRVNGHTGMGIAAIARARNTTLRGLLHTLRGPCHPICQHGNTYYLYTLCRLVI